MNTYNYSPGQNVEALRNGQWVPAHIMNPNPDGTYYIIINGTIPEYEWPEANLRGEARPYTIPATARPSVETGDLNNYLRDWYEQKADAAETMSPENRIEDFVGFIRERMNMDNLDAATEQMVRQYAQENINILFDDEDMPTQRGGKKRRGSRKLKKTNKRRNSKKRGGKKRRHTKRRR
jgi:hypothetical protein